jgi:putative membrane protein
MADLDTVDATRRTRLANERTFLAWLRTALTALAVGVAAGKIIPGVAHVTRWPFEILGVGFAVLAVVLVVYGAQRFFRVERALTTGDFDPFPTKNAIALAGIVGVLGIATIGLTFLR